MSFSGAEPETEEEFYESLDRILSSSCSSTSASDDDADLPLSRRRRCLPAPHFPPPTSLDVWIAEPAPVEERRRRLLQQLGLSRDAALARRGSASVLPLDGWAPVGRSISYEGLPASPAASSSDASIARSRSDGYGGLKPVVDSPTTQHRQRQIFNKPPLVGRSRPPSAGNLEVSDGDAGAGTVGNHLEELEDGGGGDDPRCLIKNLDTGTEFVVKGFREDGTWDKLREVRTGRQLTMEEFEMCVGRSPIVQELMRRQNVGGLDRVPSCSGVPSISPSSGSGSGPGLWSRRRGNWLRSIKSVAGSVVAGGHHRERRGSDERDTSSEKGGRRSSSATDDSQDDPHSLHHGLERTKVRQYGRSHKELSGLYMCQEIQAHSGSIWSIKFSFDGRYLASAGEDCVVHVWEVSGFEGNREVLGEKAPEENGNCNPFGAAVIDWSLEPAQALNLAEGSYWEKKRRATILGTGKSMSSDHSMVPEYVFALSEGPIRSFRGHHGDVLDLSWSKSRYLLSSSMDKTVRLWHLSSNSCLKIFSHSDYVTCIQFNPVDDRYFISGSLDEKVRIWSIPDRQIVDWNDLHEMVTAACYAPDGQSALVGTHKGSCHLYDTSDNKLLQKSQIDLQNKKKKSSHKKITGFQFAPGSSSKVLITSADSRIRVIDGLELVHKLKGFRNTNSQISASFTANGKYVICASEDSHVYVWRYDEDPEPSRSKGVVTVTQSYEHFRCQDVTVAVAWPFIGTGEIPETHMATPSGPDGESKENSLLLVEGLNWSDNGDRVSATWPEELVTGNKRGPWHNGEPLNGGLPARNWWAWGLVIVAAGWNGEIRTFQNFGFPVRA